MILPIVIAERKDPQEQASGSHATEQFGITPRSDAGDCQVFRTAGKNRRHHHQTSRREDRPTKPAETRDIILKVNISKFPF